MSKEAELVVGELLGLELAAQIVFGKELSERKFERAGDFGEGVK